MNKLGITIIDIGNDMVRLVPDEGKVLYDSRTQRTYSIVETHKSKVKYFKEIDK